MMLLTRQAIPAVGGISAIIISGNALRKWTNSAREDLFKSQYVDYVRHKLESIVDCTRSNCSQHVQQELKLTFARLCNQADLTTCKLDDEIKQKEKVITQLRDVVSESKTFKNKAVQLDKALDTFRDTFLTVA